jgi:hypothetical protein
LDTNVPEDEPDDGLGLAAVVAVVAAAALRADTP